MEDSKTFFGLEVKSVQKQLKSLKPLEKDLKISQACLEPNKNMKKEPVSLMVEYEKKQFILAVLDPSTSWQSPLDIIFEAGAEVKFFLKGNGVVHLTGYYLPDDMDDLSMSMSSDAELSDDSDSEEAPLAIESAKKRRSSGPIKAITNGVPSPSKKKGNEPQGKKRPREEVDDDDDDDDDEDDEDFMGELGSDDDDDDDDNEAESDSDIDEDNDMSDEDISESDEDEDE